MRLTRENWGIAARGIYTRQLSLIHPAPQEMYPGLEDDLK
jgi:hypothetical protein